MTNLVKKIQNTCFQHNLFKRDDKIVLAVSGGPDSSAMLDIFSRLEKKYHLQLAVAHVNYGLRGKNSDKDEKFVRDMAEKHGLEFFALHPPKKRTVSENSLREIRYSFFEKVRRKNKFDLIAVAHNLDDQIETFLMRLIRGSGLHGLSSMRHKNGLLIRPLLDIKRSDIERYIAENNLKFRVDETNKQSCFFRNKIRNKLIPYIENDFNPKIKKTLASSIISIKEDFFFLDQAAEKEYKKMKILKSDKILKLHPAIQRRILLKAIFETKGSLKNIDSSHIEEILKALRSTKNKRQMVSFKGLKMVRIGDRIEIEAK